MDFNKVSGHTILYAVTAIAAVVIAVAVRYVCLASGLDAGTANIVFVVVLAALAVLYLLLVKGIIGLADRIIAKYNERKAAITGTSATCEQGMREHFQREKLEESIAIFCEYTAIVIGKHIPATELQRLNRYVGSYAREQQLGTVEPVKVPPHKISNNDLYHYGWNLWNHFRDNRADKRQEFVVDWLKAVFANLESVEAVTIKGKLTIHDSKGSIPLLKSIPDFLRLLRE